MLAARNTVITVPSTGSVIARLTKLSARESDVVMEAPVRTPPSAAWAMPRSTWLSTTPELPRAPRTAPVARAAAMGAASVRASGLSVASSCALASADSIV